MKRENERNERRRTRRRRRVQPTTTWRKTDHHHHHPLANHRKTLKNTPSRRLPTRTQIKKGNLYDAPHRVHLFFRSPFRLPALSVLVDYQLPPPLQQTIGTQHPFPHPPHRVYSRRSFFQHTPRLPSLYSCRSTLAFDSFAFRPRSRRCAPSPRRRLVNIGRSGGGSEVVEGERRGWGGMGPKTTSSLSSLVAVLSSFSVSPLPFASPFRGGDDANTQKTPETTRLFAAVAADPLLSARRWIAAPSLVVSGSLSSLAKYCRCSRNSRARV